MKRWSDFDSLAVLVAAIGALEAGAVASGTVAWDAAIGEAGAGGVAVEGAVVCALAQSVVDSSKAAAQANFVVMRYSSFARVARVCGGQRRVWAIVRAGLRPKAGAGRALPRPAASAEA
jgi:hypothetical protein